MAAPIKLREDFDGPAPRAKRTRDATQGRRRLALAEIYDGALRRAAERIGGVRLQIIRGSLPGSACMHAREGGLRFNARGPDRLIGSGIIIDFRPPTKIIGS